MRHSFALVLLGWSLLCSGCALIEDANHNLFVGMTAPVEAHREIARNRKWADAAWQKVCASEGFGERSDDYVHGFKDGYVEYLFRGGDGEPPLVAPLHYRHIRYQNAAGYLAIQSWFAGYRHGAAVARDSGARELITGPSALRVEANIAPLPLHGAEIVPPRGVNPLPIVPDRPGEKPIDSFPLPKPQILPKALEEGKGAEPAKIPLGAPQSTLPREFLAPPRSLPPPPLQTPTAKIGEGVRPALESAAPKQPPVAPVQIRNSLPRDYLEPPVYPQTLQFPAAAIRATERPMSEKQPSMEIRNLLPRQSFEPRVPTPANPQTLQFPAAAMSATERPMSEKQPSVEIRNLLPKESPELQAPMPVYPQTLQFPAATISVTERPRLEKQPNVEPVQIRNPLPRPDDKAHAPTPVTPQTLQFPPAATISATERPMSEKQPNVEPVQIRNQSPRPDDEARVPTPSTPQTLQFSAAAPSEASVSSFVEHSFVEPVQIWNSLPRGYVVPPMPMPPSRQTLQFPATKNTDVARSAPAAPKQPLVELARVRITNLRAEFVEGAELTSEEQEPRAPVRVRITGMTVAPAQD